MICERETYPFSLRQERERERERECGGENSNKDSSLEIGGKTPDSSSFGSLPNLKIKLEFGAKSEREENMQQREENKVNEKQAKTSPGKKKRSSDQSSRLSSLCVSTCLFWFDRSISIDPWIHSIAELPFDLH